MDNDVENLPGEGLVLASTIILLRDSDLGPEVFMLARHAKMESFAGALVFPGGKVDVQDSSARLKPFCLAEGADDSALALKVAAIREAFEEAGVLFARGRETGDLLDAVRMAALSGYREKLDAREQSLADFLKQENLELATDLPVHFSNWITPVMLHHKRFDTHFFVAAVPPGIELLHCGRETDGSLWGRPQQLLDEAEAGRLNMVFPTLCNLSKIALGNSVAEIIAAAKSALPVEALLPKTEKRGNQVHVSIPRNAGFPMYRQTIVREIK